MKRNDGRILVKVKTQNIVRRKAFMDFYNQRMVFVSFDYFKRSVGCYFRNHMKSNLEGSKTVSYEFRNDVDTGNFSTKGYSAILYPPRTAINGSSNFKIVTQKSLSRFANDRIEKDIYQALENNIIADSLKIDPKKIDALKKRAELTSVESVKKDELGRSPASNFNLASSIGYVTAFLIYITLFVYGVMVMRGVMEEKTNRIAEVMVSSVKPFQLMMGKIIGSLLRRARHGRILFLYLLQHFGRYKRHHNRGDAEK